MEILYAVIGIAALVAIYFLFLRKPAAPQIEAPPEPAKLPDKPKADAPKADAPKADVPKPAPSKPAADKPKEKAQPAPAEAKVDKPKAPSERPAAPVEEAEKPSDARAIPKAVEDEDEPSLRTKPTVVEGRPPAPPPPSAKPKAAPSDARKRDVEGLRKGLAKARESEGFFGRLKALFTGKKEIDPQIVEQMEEVLLTSDVGVKTTEKLLAAIKTKLDKKELSDADRVWDSLREHAIEIVNIGGGGIALTTRPTVVMVVGVNGAGKTTTIGKLSTRYKAEGKKVVLAAGDTFRAAAVQQLMVWGKRVGCEVVKGKDGANPGAVIFDAIQKAKEIGADVVLADTAGRLHTKTNLMEELVKVSRTMAKAMDGAPHETLLVLDATNGQNAMQQAAMFKEALPISGIVLTKLDGTAKGGIVLGIVEEHQIPVRYIGIGERPEDLRDFDAQEFVEAMLGQDSQTSGS